MKPPRRCRVCGRLEAECTGREAWRELAEEDRREADERREKGGEDE